MTISLVTTAPSRLGTNTERKGVPLKTVIEWDINHSSPKWVRFGRCTELGSESHWLGAQGRGGDWARDRQCRVQADRVRAGQCQHNTSLWALLLPCQQREVCGTTAQPGTKRRRDQDHHSVISFFFFRIQAYTVIYAHYIHNYILISAYKSYVKIIFFPQIYKFSL